MVQVNVFIYDISAERLWEIEKAIPPVKVSTNLNVVGMNKKPKGLLELPFVFTINYAACSGPNQRERKSLREGIQGRSQKDP